MNNFFGVDMSIGETKIDMEPVKLTEQVIEEAMARILEQAGRPYCQDSKGVFHHMPWGFDPKICQLCGWTL